MAGSPGDPIASIGVLGEPTRRRLYDYVAAQAEPVSRDGAAGALGLGRPIVSFHLDRLAAAGLLEVEYRRLSGRSGPGAGRPAKLYRRARSVVEVSLPARRYETAAAIFAQALEGPTEDGPGAGPSATLLEAARAYGRELAARGAEGSAGGGDDALVRLLGSVGFEPLTDPASRVVRLRNCPFDALARDHRELTCSMNLALLSGVADAIGEIGLEPAMAPEPGFCCVVFAPSPDGPRV